MKFPAIDWTTDRGLTEPWNPHRNAWSNRMPCATATTKAPTWCQSQTLHSQTLSCQSRSYADFRLSVRTRAVGRASAAGKCGQRYLVVCARTPPPSRVWSCERLWWVLIWCTRPSVAIQIWAFWLRFHPIQWRQNKPLEGSVWPHQTRGRWRPGSPRQSSELSERITPSMTLHFHANCPRSRPDTEPTGQVQNQSCQSSSRIVSTRILHLWPSGCWRSDIGCLMRGLRQRWVSCWSKELNRWGDRHSSSWDDGHRPMIAFCRVRFLARKPCPPLRFGGCGCCSATHSNT